MRRQTNPDVVVAKLGLVLLAVIAVALLWTAAEQHYRGCVEARAAVALANGDMANSLNVNGGPAFSGDEPKSIAYAPAGVTLRGCSRSPF